ncbi:MAG: hypothetical protein B6226_02245 [Candidatus Cloacimonetes bacterium 4572_65]|nr:MAG: hypothetical protein B6226_02245 [Candidatus Cloacimonetes bacterium 4572_65]
MKKLIQMIIITIMLLSVVACSTHTHKVGKGAQGNNVQAERQWYALWGLIPLNDVNTAEMVNGAEDYDIKTEQTFVDGLINIVLTYTTITARTVEVKK